MPEILTESFCERCGTRYTFQAAASARGPITRVRHLTKGFRNYVLSDETSLSEAMASARSEDLRRTSGEQLDAFHKAFNFCMSCRQYTCANCWNEIDGRCLSCAPTADSEPLAAASGILEQLIGLPAADAVNGNGHSVASPDVASNGHMEASVNGTDVSAWPSVDLVVDPDLDPAEDVGATTGTNPMAEPATAEVDAATEPGVQPPADMGISAERFAAMFGAPALATPSSEPMATVGSAAAVGADAVAADQTPGADEAVVPDAIGSQPIAADVTEPAGAVASEAAADDEQAVVEAPEAVAHTGTASGVEADSNFATDQIRDLDGWAASAAAQTSTVFDRFRAFPGMPSAASRADLTAPDPDSEPLVAQADPPEVPPAATEVGALEPTVDLAPRPELEPVAAAELEVPTEAVAPVVEPEPVLPVPATATAVPTAPTTPIWQMVAPDADGSVPTTASSPVPTGQPQWPTAAAWPAQRSSGSSVSGADAVWAQSSRDLLNRPETGVQACVNCGLALSARARFCRRCGSSQVASA